MENQKLRAPAVPLVTHDPLFSVWSFATNLTDDVTRHWDGQRQAMFGLVTFDKEIYEFMGKAYYDDGRYSSGFRKLPQTGLEIRPMTTRYTFENEKLALELTFTSPLLLNDLMILSRPVTYVDYRITPKTPGEHDIHVHFGFSGEFCVNEITQKVAPVMTPFSLALTSGTREMFLRSGDDHRIEWGTLHIVAPDYIQEVKTLRNYHIWLSANYSSTVRAVNPMSPQGPRRECAGPQRIEAYEEISVAPYWPTALVRKEWNGNTGEICDGIAIAYDDVKSLQYFGRNIDAYWKKDGDSFTQMIRKAINEHDEVLQKVRVFEEDLLAKARKISYKYAEIVALAYRQVIAGHKLTWHDGEIQFISKENYSNGSAGTVDVTYPSIPLFLIYEPTLVEGMLNPIFKMIDQGLWEHEFAPHDIGTYPLCNGQTYGYTMRHRGMRMPIDSQMPVEECGNMILCVAAACFAKKDTAYFAAHKALLQQWADYLVKIGYNPDNQLCTDDFAGHLAHNVNLSAKAICALGAFAKLLSQTGDEAAGFYRAKAEEFAAALEREARGATCYKLTFDREDTWSLKYNMVWDKLMDLQLFSREVYDTELACYKEKVGYYGIPMDCRGDYTKTDWEMWSTMLFEDADYTGQVVDAMWNFFNETPDRVPMTDLHFLSQPWERACHARTVQGGLFINLLTF